MAAQLGLLEWSPPDIAPRASEQSIQIARVAGRLADEILAWLRRRIENGAPEFFAADLALHVQHKLGGSPESALRILRMLRKAGQADVELVSRSQSLYRVRGVR